MIGRPLKPLSVSDADLAKLQMLAWWPKTSQRTAQRAQIVMMCADGYSNTEVAEELGLARPTVGKWRERYRLHGIEGLVDEPRPQAPRKVTDDVVERVITKTLEETPRGKTHWSRRDMAQATGLSHAKHPRFHVHFTPTYSSWLNLVERLFSEITTKAIRRGSFPSVHALKKAIAEYLDARNDRPFIWTATADDILRRGSNFCKRTSVPGH